MQLGVVAVAHQSSVEALLSRARHSVSQWLGRMWRGVWLFQPCAAPHGTPDGLRLWHGSGWCGDTLSTYKSKISSRSQRVCGRCAIGIGGYRSLCCCSRYGSQGQGCGRRQMGPRTCRHRFLSTTNISFALCLLTGVLSSLAACLHSAARVGRSSIFCFHNMRGKRLLVIMMVVSEASLIGCGASSAARTRWRVTPRACLAAAALRFLHLWFRGGTHSIHDAKVPANAAQPCRHRAMVIFIGHGVVTVLTHCRVERSPKKQMCFPRTRAEEHAILEDLRRR